MRYIPIVKFFSEEFVDVVPATTTAVADDGDRDEQQLIYDARIEEEFRALRKWDVL